MAPGANVDGSQRDRASEQSTDRFDRVPQVWGELASHIGPTAYMVPRRASTSPANHSPVGGTAGEVDRNFP
jgi:hypothetical protein